MSKAPPAPKISISLHQTGANSNDLNIFATYFSSFSSSKWGLCRLDQGHHSHTPPHSMNSARDAFAHFLQIKLHLCLPTKRAVRVSLFPATLEDGEPAQFSMLLIGKFAFTFFPNLRKADPQKCDHLQTD